MLQAAGMGREKILICTNLGYVSYLSQRPWAGAARVQSEEREAGGEEHKAEALLKGSGSCAQQVLSYVWLYLRK